MFLFHVNTSGAIALFVWLVIAIPQLVLRCRMGEEAKNLTLKMWFFPYLTWLSIITITALLVGMVIVSGTREALLTSVGLAAVVVAIGLYRYRRGSAARDTGIVEQSAGKTPVGGPLPDPIATVDGDAQSRV